MEKEITITGVYYKDSNFINVFVDDKMYTIARNTGEWGSVAVGQSTNYGTLTQEQFNQWKAKANKTGTFTLK